MAWFTAGLQSLLSEAILTFLVLVGAWLLRSRATEKRRAAAAAKKQAKLKAHDDPRYQPRKEQQGAASKTAKAAQSPSASAAGQADAVAEKADSSEPNLLITAVRKGRVSELPYLLDMACERSAEKCGRDSAEFRAEANEHLLRVLRTCAASQQYAASIQAYEHMKEHIGDGSMATWSLLLYNAAECGEHATGMEFYKKIEAHHIPSSQDFVNVVRCLASSKDPLGLRSLLQRASASQVVLDAATRNRALSACCLEGALELGEVLAKSNAFSEPLDAVGTNTLMKGFARVGKLKRCLQLHEEMTQQGVESTETTYGILLDACITARDYDQAMQICESIKGKGLTLNKIHITTVIKGLASSGQMDKADALLRNMKTSMNIEPDIVTYQTLVKAHVERGDLDAALVLFQELTEQELQPDALIVDCVLNGCCSPGLPEARLIRIFDTLGVRGAKPSNGAVNLLVRSLAQNGNWQAAFDFLQNMESRFGMNCSANLHAQLGLACVKAGEMETAKKVCRAISGAEDFEKFVSCRLLQQCVQTGDAAEAMAVAFGGGSAQNGSVAGKDVVDKSSSGVAPVELLMACSSSLASRLTLSPNDARLAQFISTNQLEMESARRLSKLPRPVAEWVLDQGFILRGDCKAAVVERIQDAEQVAAFNSKYWESYPDAAGLKRRIEDYTTLNKLDQRCVETLKRLSRQQVLWVMDQEFYVSVDPSKGTAAAKVIANIRKAWSAAKSNMQLPDRRAGQAAPPSLSGAAAVKCALDDFIELNRLDERCSRLLRSLPPADAAWVMDQEFRIAVNPTKGTAAAKVVGLVNKARSAGIGGSASK